MLNKKDSKGNDLGGDDDDDFPVSPSTDAQYRKINAEFARAMNTERDPKVTIFKKIGYLQPLVNSFSIILLLKMALFQ